jgi:hypothetical protein
VNKFVSIHGGQVSRGTGMILPDNRRSQRALQRGTELVLEAIPEQRLSKYSADFADVNHACSEGRIWLAAVRHPACRLVLERGVA